MLDFPGVELTITDEAYILSSNPALYTLSSAVVGGGFGYTDTIINRHVPHNYNCADPIEDLHHYVSMAQLPVKDIFVGLLTGVPMKGTRYVSVCQDGLTVASVITAGISHAVTSGRSVPVPFVPGTINIVVLIDAKLEAAAQVNAVITATEAKTSILQDCGVRTLEGYAATGTSTDAVVIACTGRGAALPYAGPGTLVGYLIGSSVRQALLKALEPCKVFPFEK